MIRLNIICVLIFSIINIISIIIIFVLLTKTFCKTSSDIIILILVNIFFNLEYKVTYYNINKYFEA